MVTVQQEYALVVKSQNREDIYTGTDGKQHTASRFGPLGVGYKLSDGRFALLMADGSTMIGSDVEIRQRVQEMYGLDSRFSECNCGCGCVSMSTYAQEMGTTSYDVTKHIRAELEKINNPGEQVNPVEVLKASRRNIKV